MITELIIGEGAASPGSGGWCIMVVRSDFSFMFLTQLFPLLEIN